MFGLAPRFLGNQPCRFKRNFCVGRSWKSCKNEEQYDQRCIKSKQTNVWRHNAMLFESRFSVGGNIQSSPCKSDCTATDNSFVKINLRLWSRDKCSVVFSSIDLCYTRNNNFYIIFTVQDASPMQKFVTNKKMSYFLLMVYEEEGGAWPH
jgi:hypothetical protein